MIGSPAIASVIAVWGFWVLLALGCVRQQIGLAGGATFLLLWFIGLVGLPYVPWTPAHAMFSSWVAVLDIALVFAIFKGDVSLT